MYATAGVNVANDTFTLIVKIGTCFFTTLVDIGSCGIFLHTKAAKKARCKLSSYKPAKVKVTNGDILWSTNKALNCPYTIQGTSFTEDFRIPTPTGHDIRLGADWLKRTIPFEWITTSDR